MTYTFDGNIVSDLYKDAYGWRPREGFWSQWINASDAEKQTIWDRLCEAVRISIAEEKAAEEAAIAKFEDLVTNLMHPGTNRERVIAWLMQSEGADGDYDYFTHTQGLPYGYFTRKDSK
jgi:hypothetical protein